jgi:hypothetical protein
VTAPTNAPQGVDVLAVMDRLIGNARTMAGLSGDPVLRSNVRDAEEARAAVAELLGAAAYALRHRDDAGALSDTAEHNLTEAIRGCGVAP